ncbi:NAD-binding component of TrK potassium transporter [Bacteroidales bacterium]|nr:NAD-binding component of TrK potassium transporter [Bacteroidales bacterium]
MKILIVGAGQVGTHLAKLLSKEDHDIVLMDSDESRLVFTANIEIMSLEGNPTSLSDLNKAGVSTCDIFIAVTPDESVNMTACMLATNMGAHKTIARISNKEYLLQKNTEFFAKLGVDSLICPEMLAAQEIVNTLKKPWTRQWWELCGGALILIGVKVRKNAPVVDKYLSDLSKDNKIYHVVVIKRDRETIIPRGDDKIKADDILYFSTTKEHIDNIRQCTGKTNVEIKKVTIMGGSRIAVKLSEYLPSNIRIKILETSKSKSYKLAEKIGNNVMIINGDGRDTDLLIQENIKDSDAFVALTDSSETNILACVAAKSLGVPKTVAQVENLDYIQMAEKLNIGSVINKKLIAVSHMYRFLLDADVSNVKCLAFADADVAELIARPKSKVTRKPVNKLNLPKDMTLGGLIRNGKATMINGETQIEAYDQVVVFCLETALRKIEDYFN